MWVGDQSPSLFTASILHRLMRVSRNWNLIPLCRLLAQLPQGDCLHGMNEHDDVQGQVVACPNEKDDLQCNGSSDRDAGWQADAGTNPRIQARISPIEFTMLSP